MTDAGTVLPVVVCAGRHETCRRTADAVVWRSDLGQDDVLRVDGIPITSPRRSGFDIARLSPLTGKPGRTAQDAEESLVLFDALLRTGP